MGRCCGSSGARGPATKYKVTLPSGGGTRVFLTEPEAKAAVSRAGGGTIEPVRPPRT